MTEPKPKENQLPEESQVFCGLLAAAIQLGASDIHLASDDVAWCRVNGELQVLPESPVIDHQELNRIVNQRIGSRGMKQLEERGSCDGAWCHDGKFRFRFNIYRSNGRLSMALRHLDDGFRTLEELGLPAELRTICNYKDGLVLVAGPTGSGKSTTLASLINDINVSRRAHIVTIEDPIEYIHRNRMSRISQRQVGVDTGSFHAALADAVRQDPDVILVGEMRDLDTIRTAVMAAETGHLVFATVHAGDCIGAIDRMTGVFPGDEQTMIRNLLAGSLRTVIAQHLLVADSSTTSTARPDNVASRGRVLASEVLHVNAAARNLIAIDNLAQLQSVLEMHRSDGMYTLDSSLARLWRKRQISEATARSIARNPKMLRELSRAI